MKKTAIISIIGALLLSMSLITCGGSGETASGSGQTAEPTAEPTASGSKTPADTLVLGMKTDIIAFLDPAQNFETTGSRVVENGYESLMSVGYENGQFTIEPGLAETWDISADGTEYTFHLRDGLKFSNGDPLTSEDVVYSFQRVLALDGQPAWQFSDVLGLTADSITAPEPQTVVFKVADQPQMVILSIIGNNVGSIVNKKLVQSHEVDGDWGTAWLNDQNVGATAGPFEITSWERNTSITMVANPNYWDAANVKLKRIIVKDIPDETKRYLELQNGEIDAAFLLTADMAKEIDSGAVAGVTLPTVTGQSLEYLAMNYQWGPFQDNRVRQAVKYAIDYDAIIDHVKNGYATKVQQYIPVGYLGYEEKNPYNRDVARAKELLAEAGYADGFEVELATTSSETRKQEAVIIQENLAEIGIRANVVQMESAQFYAKYREQGLQMLVAGWGIDYPDTSALANPFTNHRAGQLAWRVAWIDDKAADLAEAGNNAKDESEKIAYYHELRDYFLDDGPFAILYQQDTFFGVRDNVVGWLDGFLGYSVRSNMAYISKK